MGTWQTEQGESPTRRSVRELTERGFTARQIAQALDISTQRVYQQQQKIDEAREAATSEATA